MTDLPTRRKAIHMHHNRFLVRLRIRSIGSQTHCSFFPIRGRVIRHRCLLLANRSCLHSRFSIAADDKTEQLGRTNCVMIFVHLPKRMWREVYFYFFLSFFEIAGKRTSFQNIFISSVRYGLWTNVRAQFEPGFTVIKTKPRCNTAPNVYVYRCFCFNNLFSHLKTDINILWKRTLNIHKFSAPHGMLHYTQDNESAQVAPGMHNNNFILHTNFSILLRIALLHIFTAIKSMAICLPLPLSLYMYATNWEGHNAVRTCIYQ